MASAVYCPNRTTRRRWLADSPIKENEMPVALKIVNAPPEVEMRARQLFTAGLITRLIDFAPYSASLVRIYFAYLGGLGLERNSSDAISTIFPICGICFTLLS